MLLNGLGRYEEALAAAQEASDDTPELFVSVWAALELLEAATRCDRPELAQATLERIVAATSVAPSDWALGIQARSRALLSQGEEAERLYLEAIEWLGRTRLRPELARTHLLFGEWLRRENRRVDARAQLRAAHDLFVTTGMEAFAERARGELLATGEKVRKRMLETRDELTPQERQIARLARDGLSNPEIGARLFLSPRTVEWHLRKVFAKLGHPLPARAAQCPTELRLGARARLSSGAGQRLEDPPAQISLEVAVDAQPERLEPGEALILRGPPRQLEEIGERRWELAVGGQRHLVDMGLRARNRLVIEACDACGDRVDLVVEPVVGDRPVHVPVLLGSRPVEIVGDEQDLERPAAADQSR